MKWSRCFLSLFVLFFASSCGSDPVQPIVIDVEAMFEQMWNDFDRNYSYFDTKNVDWDSVYQANRPQIINGETSLAELAEIMGQMTLSLRDLHVRFQANGITYQFDNRDQFEANSPANAVNYLSVVGFENASLLFGDIADQEISYLHFKNLSSDGVFDPLLTLLATAGNKAGLILDLRDNSGGNDAIASGFVSRLIQQEYLYEFVRFRDGPESDDFGEWIERRIVPDNPISFDNPIMVLINRGTVSSAESFTAMMSTLPNVTLIGDITRGSTGNPGLFTLSNGWSYRISRWQAATPDFMLIEDLGIAPDIAITNTQESVSDGRDLILEEAIAQIISQ